MAKFKLAVDFRDFLKLCLRHGVRFHVIGGIDELDSQQIETAGPQIPLNERRFLQ